MTQVNFHFTGPKSNPTARVAALKDCGDTMVLNIINQEASVATLFFDNEDALADFVDSIQTAFTAYLQNTEEK